jgi:hypothetical protein
MWKNIECMSSINNYSLIKLSVKKRSKKCMEEEVGRVEALRLEREWKKISYECLRVVGRCKVHLELCIMKVISQSNNSLFEKI